MISTLSQFVDAVDAIMSFPNIKLALCERDNELPFLSYASLEYNEFISDQEKVSDEQVQELDEKLEEIEMSADHFTLIDSSSINQVALKALTKKDITIFQSNNGQFVLMRDGIHIYI
jgi:hypothetical protein